MNVHHFQGKSAKFWLQLIQSDAKRCFCFFTSVSCHCKILLVKQITGYDIFFLQVTSCRQVGGDGIIILEVCRSCFDFDDQHLNVILIKKSYYHPICNGYPFSFFIYKKKCQPKKKSCSQGYIGPTQFSIVNVHFNFFKL